MPTTRRRRSRTFCTSALAPIGRCFLSAGDERRSAWSPRRMTLATMVSPKASVLHATPHGDTWEKPVGLLPFCPRSLSRPRRSPALGEGGSASSPGSIFLAVSLNAMYVRFRSGSVIAVPLHARISGVATVTDGDTLKIWARAHPAPRHRRAGVGAALPRPVAEHGFAAPRPPGCFAAASPAGRSSALSATATATATGASSRCAASTAPT